MINESSKEEIAAFLSQISLMTAAQFEQINTVARASYDVRHAARSLLKLSAADFSWLDKQVRDVIRVLRSSQEWPSVRVASLAVPMTLDACQAMVRRDRLTEEQYESFVGSFRGCGVNLPLHQAGETAV